MSRVARPFAPVTTVPPPTVATRSPATIGAEAQRAGAELARLSRTMEQALRANDGPLFLRAAVDVGSIAVTLRGLATEAEALAAREPAYAPFAASVVATASGAEAAVKHVQALVASLTPSQASFQREARLTELMLGGKHATHVVTMSSPGNAPKGAQRPHQVRLSATGLHTRTDTALGEKPVLAPRAGPGGKIARHRHPTPAWDARETRNLPFLCAGRCYASTDAFDFQVFKNSPTAAAAMAELAMAIEPTRRARDPGDVIMGPLRVDPSTLSPAAQALWAIAGGAPGGGLPITLHGELQRAVTHLFAEYGHHFVMNEAMAARALGDAPAAAFFAMLREAIPERRGLQQVMHRAHLPMEPTDGDTPLTREEAHALAHSDPAELERLEQSAPIPPSLRALEQAGALVRADAFKDVHIVAVQHVLSTNVTMFAALEDKGADPRRTEIVGIPYSTNYVVESALRRRGYTIDTPLVVDPNDITAAYERAVEGALARAVARAQQDGKPILLIDDGGKATAVAARKYPHLAHLFRSVEQTTRGLTEIAKVEAERGGPMPFPVVDVAKSPLKAHEMPKIGAQVAAEIDKLTSMIGLEAIKNKDVTVMGFGPIGQGVALALRERGARVTVFDPAPEARARARAAGFDAPDDRASALRGKALVVGATGHRSIGREDIAHLSHECVLASASSRDVEIDLSVNRDKDVETVPLLSAGRGDRRFVTRVWRFGDKDPTSGGGKDIVVLKNGFPLNFNGDYETGTAADIEQTRAIMLLGAAQAVGGLATAQPPSAPGLQALSLDAQRAFAKAFGVPVP